LANNLLDFNQWQHLAFTYDGSNIHLYKNGVLISSTPANGIITQTAQSFKIGALDWNGTGFYMNGSLDEIRLWNITLSQNTISNWMCNEITTLHPNYNHLVGYWRLNEGVGTTTTDLSLNANNGTLNNNPTWQVATSCFGSTVTPLTYVPDDNFENYLEANGMGDGIALNDYVFTSAIDTVTNLDVSNQNIIDLTGIEDFTVLTDLHCYSNQLTSLDVSQNTALIKLFCADNQLTSIDISGATALDYLGCTDNQLTSLDLSQNTALEYLYCAVNLISSIDISGATALKLLYCYGNQLISIDLSNHTALVWLNCSGNQLTNLNVSSGIGLTDLDCSNNQLSSLDLRNGNNINMTFNTFNNLNLTCIDVDDVALATTSWTVANSDIDAQHYFSTDCSVTAIEETKVSEKELLKITDVLGRKVLGNSHQPLFYIYNDGSVEKKIIIE